MNVVAFLQSLGLDGSLQGEEYVAPCPAHKERTGKPDAHPSFSVNVEKRVFQCFSCGFRGTLAVLISYLGGVSWPEDFSEGDLREVIDEIIVHRYLRKASDHSLPESSLAVFVDPPEEAAADRGFSPDAAREMGVLWDHRTDSWIIPIRRTDGSLLGWQVKSHRGRRFRNFPTGVPKSESLFGFSAAGESSYSVVVESPLDAVLFRHHGVVSVSVYGSSLSRKQLLALSRFSTVFAAFDNDGPGRRAVEQLALHMPGSTMLVEYPDGVKDPGDHPDVLALIRTGRSYLDKRLEEIISAGR